jgi:hypothetical protein
MDRVVIEEPCLHCDELVEGVVVHGQYIEEDSVDWPEVCPHCGEDDYLYGGSDEREDFYAGT